MPDRLVWWIGDRDPSISDQITVDGVPVDLSAKTVQFKMRPFGSTTLKVNQPVSFKDSGGNWRYDWGATDLNTEDQYLVWVEVTTGAKVQTLWESTIEVRAHSPLENSYVELEELKSSTELTSTTFADQDLRNAIVAASRAVDNHTGQRFWPDLVDQTRYYTANGTEVLRIDPLISLTSLATDPSDDGTYESTWATTDYRLEPSNAVLNGQPYSSIRRLTGGAYSWPSFSDAVKVTGKFGWATPPEAVKVATTIIAARFVKRMREAPFGIAGFDGIGAAVRISRFDPDVEQLLSPYVTRPLLV